MSKIDKFWEFIAYVSLAGCIVGQIIVGYTYLLAQGVYLVCNTLATIRSFVIHQKPADKIKNLVFTAITAGLIIIWVFKAQI